MRMLLISLVVIVLIIALTGVWFFKQGNSDLVSGETTVKIGSGEYIVEIADSPALKAKGLSGRDGLDAGQGMLFIFNPVSKTSFWMKGMKFSIDIIWIADGEVVSIEERASLPKGMNIPVYRPKVKANYVLEVNAGEVEKHGIKVGDKVEIR